jgi:hypothetical protein
MISAYFMGGGGLFLILSLYEQQGLGKDAFSAALTFTGFAFAVLVASITASRFAALHRTKFLFGGFASLCAGLATVVVGLALTRDGDARAAVATGLALYGLGHGSVSPIMYSTVLSGVPLRSAGAASGVLSTCQQVASALGVAVIGLIFSTALAGRTGPMAHAGAASCALAVNLATMVIAAYLSTRLPRTGLTTVVAEPP